MKKYNMKTVRNTDFEREIIARLKDMNSTLQVIAEDYRNAISKWDRADREKAGVDVK